METVKCFGLLILLLYDIILNFEAEARIDGRNIRLQEFKEEIATGDEWISLFRIEIGQPTERLRRKIKAKWNILDTENTTILRNTVAWRPDNDRCGLVNVMSEPDEADLWGQGGVVLKQVNSTFKRQIRFVSSNASSYFWWTICFNREDIVANYCPDLIVVLMVPASRLQYHREADMTGLELDRIASDLQAINSTVSFGDQRLRYNWLGTECDFNANKMVGNRTCSGDTSGSSNCKISHGWMILLLVGAISFLTSTNLQSCACINKLSYI